MFSFSPQDLEKVRRDGASSKEVEKAEAKLKKAHDEYRTLVEKYNNIREEFEKRMTTSCMVCVLPSQSSLYLVLCMYPVLPKLTIQLYLCSLQD